MYQKYNFENLEVYQLANQLLKRIYKISSKFPKAEGSIKSKKEFARFINIALAS
jgi:hypothetical protein